MSIVVDLSPEIRVGDDQPMLVISGPCVIESYELCRSIAKSVQASCKALGLSYVFKASFDKANRTSIRSFRGPGMEEGLEILAAIKKEFGVPVLTDVHESAQIDAVAAVVDILQIPAFLCRQTDLLVAAAHSGRVVNIKKGQMVAPADMRPAVDKVRNSGNDRVFLTERGYTFGYNNLVVDMRALPIMRAIGVPVIFDATHSVQLPGGGAGDTTGGQREYAPVLFRAAAAVGIDGVFIETHPRPDEAMSDGPNAILLDALEGVLKTGAAIHELVRTSRAN